MADLWAVPPLPTGTPEPTERQESQAEAAFPPGQPAPGSYPPPPDFGAAPPPPPDFGAAPPPPPGLGAAPPPPGLGAAPPAPDFGATVPPPPDAAFGAPEGPAQGWQQVPDPNAASQQPPAPALGMEMGSAILQMQEAPLASASLQPSEIQMPTEPPNPERLSQESPPSMELGSLELRDVEPRYFGGSFLLVSGPEGSVSIPDIALSFNNLGLSVLKGDGLPVALISWNDMVNLTTGAPIKTEEGWPAVELTVQTLQKEHHFAVPTDDEAEFRIAIANLSTNCGPNLAKAKKAKGKMSLRAVLWGTVGFLAAVIIGLVAAQLSGALHL